MPGATNPLVVLIGSLLMLSGVALALHWTFGTGRQLPSPRVLDPDDPTGDGLLVEVARLPTEAAAQLLRTRLHHAGIRATIGNPGFRVLVFTTDAGTAKLLLNEDDPS